MPTVRDIEQRLYEIAPKELAFPWDNVGQLLGDPEQTVEKVLDNTKCIFFFIYFYNLF